MTMSVSPKMAVSLALTASAIAILATYFSFPRAKNLTIHGESIQVMSTSPLTIQGSFYIGPPKVQVLPGQPPTVVQIPGQTVVMSHETGGACLIANLNFKSIPAIATCSNDKECTAAIPADYVGKFTDANGHVKDRAWYSYCIDKSCWIRPGAADLPFGTPGAYCLRSPARPWATGSHEFGPSPESDTIYTVEDMYRELKIGPAKVDWRVHACMNESVHFWADNDACHTPDDDVNRLLDNGPVASVP